MSKVVACIDGSVAASAVCDAGVWASRRLDAPLKLLHVLDQQRYPSTPTDLSGSLSLGAREHLMEELADLDARRNRVAMEQGKLMLDAAKARAMDKGIDDPELQQRHGDLLESLLALQDETRLLVIGRQGTEHQGASAKVGDNVERVVRAVYRPILVVPEMFSEPGVIMLAFDGSDTCRKGVEMLAASPLFRGLDCHLVTVDDGQHARHEELAWAGERLSDGGHQVFTAILEGEVEPALHRYQQEHGIELLVMGAYGHSRIREFLLGSTTNEMLREARVPHLLLR